MSEIRDFLVPMEVPDLNSSKFAPNFQTFCQNIKDNINKIVSAPFLKGDRGGKICFIDEPLKISGQWSEFAKSLISIIYGSTGEYPLPLMSDGRLVCPEDEEWADMILIDGGEIIIKTPTDNEDPSIDPIISKYCSFDLFRSLDTIPVCYDETTGKKFFCVPFYFFDGRLNHVGYIDNYALPMFKDMSCTVFGEASFINTPTKENLENPDNWQWEMNKTNALPKLYYNMDINQFCWEVAGEKTNIIAQGIKGDQGDACRIWTCSGEVVSGNNMKKIKISYVLDEEFQVDDIKSGDLVLVHYNDDSSMAFPGEENPYYRIQFGIAHITGNERYIIYDNNYEIIGRLRNYSLHDYLRSIGTNPNTDDMTSPISALYTLERDTRNIAMALWAKNSTNHFIAPIPISATSTIGDAELSPTPNRILNILYNIVKFKKKIVVDNIESINGLNTNAIGVLQNITDDNIKNYRLGVLCNILSVQKSDSQNLARIGEGGQNFTEAYDVPVDIGGSRLSSADYLFIESELVIGWIPEDVSMIFNDNLSSNTNNPALDIYRAQKYHLYIRIPVSGSSAGVTAGMSLDGKSWKNNISLTDSLSYRGNNRTFTISIDAEMYFEENIKQILSTDISRWFRQFEGITPILNRPIPYQDNQLSCYKTNNGYEFFYEYVSPKMTFQKNKVRYGTYAGNFLIYLNQYRLNGGKFSISTGQNNAQYKIDNLFWFGKRNTGSVVSNDETKNYPLINDKFSFLNYFKRNNSFITTTNNINNWMWQGRILSADAAGGSSLGKQDLYYINTSFYETLYPSEFNAFIVKNPDPDPYNPDVRHISRVPINSIIRIYPEGMNGLSYSRVVVTNNAWGQSPISPSPETMGNYVSPYQNAIN